MTSEQITEMLDRYGIPILLLIGVGYALYKWIIPSVIRTLEAQQTYYVGEIQRLNNESREDRKVVMDLVRQNNETSAKLQVTLENLTDQIKTTQRDVAEIYRMVAKEKKLINGAKEHYGEKE